MNTNEISPKLNARLKRIKIISRTIKILLWAYFVFLLFLLLPFPRIFIGVGTSFTINGQTYDSLSAVPLVIKLIWIACFGIYFVAVITGCRLLNLYEKGIFFSAHNVRLFGRMGHLAFGYGLICVCIPTLVSGQLNIFQSLLTAASSPWILGGLFITIISLIMDEGRKIQEEQELTV